MINIFHEFLFLNLKLLGKRSSCWRKILNELGEVPFNFPLPINKRNPDHLILFKGTFFINFTYIWFSLSLQWCVWVCTREWVGEEMLCYIRVLKLGFIMHKWQHTCFVNIISEKQFYRLKLITFILLFITM